MSSKSKGLGRGFDSLLPNNFDETLLIDSKDRVQKLFITAIVPNPDQPRRHFDEQAIKELAESIKRYGILQPLIVSPEADDTYTLVAGERRWRAAQKVGLTHIPAIVRKREELEQLEVALIENVQRVDLSPLEQAISIERLHQQFNISYKAISDRLGRALPTIHNTVRLLQLPPHARNALQDNKITEGHARSILALKDNPAAQETLLDMIMTNSWSVRQAEQFVTSYKQDKKAPKTAAASISKETPATKDLAKRLDTKVSIRRMAHGGRLEIHYRDEDQLNELIGKIKS